MSQAEADTEQLDSLPEEGASTARDATRNVSALDLVRLGGQQVAQAGPRPAFRLPSLRQDAIQHPSPSLHVGVIEGIDGYDDDTKGHVADAHTAFDTMFKSIEQVIAAREASKTNPTWNENMQVIHTSVLADRVAVQTAKLVDSTLAALQKRIDHVEGELKRPLAAGAVTPIATELRALARGMKAEQRNALVMDLIEKGDTANLGALIGSGVPSVLSGLTDQQVATYTEMHNRKTKPVEAKRLAVMKVAHDKLGNAGSLYQVQIERAQGVNSAVVAKLKAAQSKAEAAFR